MRQWQRDIDNSSESQEAIQPNWANGAPFCTDDKCCQYDGKRCRLTGFRPDTICEPAVTRMAVIINKGAKP